MSIVRERRGLVEIITIDRPHKANAFDPETMEAFGAAFAEVERDDAVRVVVLTGAGDRAFCAGMDLDSLAAGWRRDGPIGIDALVRGTFPKPVIAAVNGAAVAGGFELVLGCDLVVAAEHARFGMAEVTRGLVAAGGATTLSTRIPLAVALELGLTGRLVDARRAHELGLVNEVVPAGAALEAAVALADTIAANGPLAVRATKLLLREAAGVTDWDRIAEIAAPVAASDEAIEGIAAFVERRPPRWRTG